MQTSQQLGEIAPVSLKKIEIKIYDLKLLLEESSSYMIYRTKKNWYGGVKKNGMGTVDLEKNWYGYGEFEKKNGTVRWIWNKIDTVE